MSAITQDTLHGKTVLITGAARRVGATLTRELHAAGANVVLHFRSSELAAEALARELNQARAGSAVSAQADLLDTAQLNALPELALRTFGSLDVLINNASTFYPTPVGETTAQEWDDLMGTNLRAPLFLAQAAAGALRASAGLILNIADIHGMRPLSRHTIYSVAKAGLIMLTKSLARELGPQIRVNAIAPGPVLWPEGGIDPGLQQKIVADTLLKRAGSPTDIACAALFFASQAPFVTGQILAVDGGRSVCW